MSPDREPPVSADSAENLTASAVTFSSSTPSIPLSGESASREDQLLAAARAGDREALGELLTGYRSYLLEVASRASGDRHADCESDVQEAFGRAVEALPEFRNTTARQFLAWLATTTRNVVFDRARRPASRPLPLGSSDLERMPDDGSSPSSALRRREDAAWVMAAVGRLPEQWQEVIRLREFEDLPHAEVAARLGITKEYARTLWMRALTQLGTDLGGER